MNRRQFGLLAGATAFELLSDGAMRKIVTGEVDPSDLEKLVQPEEANAARRHVVPFERSNGKPYELHPDYQEVFYNGSGFKDTVDIDNRARQQHWAIDYVAPNGTEVVSPGYGLKVDTIADTRNFGKTVVLKNSRDNGFGQYKFHGFSHLSEYGDIREGQELEMGQVIGYVGNTGRWMPRSRTPHLHHEIRQGTHTEKFRNQILIAYKTDSPYSRGSARDITEREARALNPLDNLIWVEKDDTTLYLPTSMDFVQDPSKLFGKTITPIITPKKEGRAGYQPE